MHEFDSPNIEHDTRSESMTTRHNTPDVNVEITEDTNVQVASEELHDISPRHEDNDVMDEFIENWPTQDESSQ